MDETRLHSNEKDQCQHDSARAFPQSPCYCCHNQYLSLSLHCRQERWDDMTREKSNIVRKIVLWMKNKINRKRIYASHS